MMTTLNSNLSHLNSTIAGKSQQNDQFKATKMWNDVLHAFYLGIELKKHRRQMKSYYDCFTASEAITWLKNYLKNNQNFNTNKVTRFQALNLLRKYHKSNIIERINLVKNDLELKDNNELFRFTLDANENLPFLRTTKSEADLLNLDSDENFKIIELDIREKIEVYKQIIWSHLNRSFYNISDYIKLENIDGSALLNNITRVNSNGIVQLTDKNEDLPHWILSAMKCLINWPKASGSGNCLPKYPGFEYDVFKLIREYFVNMEEPIIPFNFYKLFIDVHELYVKALSTSRKKSLISSIHHPFSILNNGNSENHELGLPANCVYETVFSSKEPVTKIVPIDEISNVFPSLIEYFKQTTLKESNFRNLSFNSPLLSNNSSNTFKALSTIPRNSPRKKSLGNFTPKCSTSNISQNLSALSFESPPESGEYMLNKNVTFKRFYSLRKNNDNFSGQALTNQIESLSLKNQYYKLLQLLLLLLPNANRRHLQLLIRLFYKIIRNKELCLLTNDALALKEHIVDIFTRCIIRSKQEKDFNEFKSKEFVSLLIDECMEIFNVPEDYVNEINIKMIDLRNQKNKERTKNNNDFCQKISNEEYELQRDALSDVALNDLLQNIMHDDTISERDKLKWIKQFKIYHPDVYDLYFTNYKHENNPLGPNRRQQRACSLGSQTINSIKEKRDFFKRFLSLKF